MTEICGCHDKIFGKRIVNVHAHGFLTLSASPREENNPEIEHFPFHNVYEVLIYVFYCELLSTAWCMLAYVTDSKYSLISGVV